MELGVVCNLTAQSILLWLYNPLFDLHLFSSFLIFFIADRTLWTGDQPFARSLPTHRTTQTQNIHTQTSIPQVAFEPTIPVFERAKTLDCAATVIGSWQPKPTQIRFNVTCHVKGHMLKVMYCERLIMEAVAVHRRSKIHSTLTQLSKQTSLQLSLSEILKLNGTARKDRMERWNLLEYSYS
jgi:hypothetical protein